MRQRGFSRSGLWSGLLVLIAGSVQAAMPEPPIVAFDRFVTESNPVCQSQGAAQCVDRAWGFADANNDGGLSLDELQRLRADLEVWAIWRQAELADVERSGIAFGLWLVDSIGLEYLHTAYDTDGNGTISRSELLADVHLDQRPIGTVLLDPGAVDHAGIARRSVFRPPSSSACRWVRRSSELTLTAPTGRPAWLLRQGDAPLATSAVAVTWAARA